MTPCFSTHTFLEQSYASFSIISFQQIAREKLEFRVDNKLLPVLEQ